MAAKEKDVCIDIAEHYQKMSYRNRYYLASPQGKILLSIPLKEGRNQRKPVKEILIDNKENWQVKHWRTIVSLYARSPFFEYYEYRFRFLFEDSFEYLHQWNMESLKLMDELLASDLQLSETDFYKEHYGDTITDIRKTFVPQALQHISSTQYYQVFSDKTGFIPDCSALDVLFCEGSLLKFGK